MLKLRLFSVALLSSVLLLPFTVSPASAGIASGDSVKMQYGNNIIPTGTAAGLITDHTTSQLWGPGSGGEFLMTVQGGVNDGSRFLTFCIETNEFINNTSTYKVILSDSAVSGGSGGGNPDPISDATRWLFQQYYLSNLDDLTSGFAVNDKFLYNDGGDADALQAALWYLEGESGGANNALAQLATANAGNYSQANGLVQVAQLWTSAQISPETGLWVGTGNHQDQLVFSPIPEPASVIAWSLLALVGLGYAGWRRRANERPHF